MKKLVLASVMALASICLVIAPTLRAQAADQGHHSDPEPGRIQCISTSKHTDRSEAKASALEEFLNNYPQSVVKKAVLEDLMGAYQQLGKVDEDTQCGQPPAPGRSQQHEGHLYFGRAQEEPMPQDKRSAGLRRCRRACAKGPYGSQARRQLSDADWKKMTDATYPVFHSAIALDYVNSKKDYKAAIDEYKKELMMYPLAADHKSVQGWSIRCSWPKPMPSPVPGTKFRPSGSMLALGTLLRRPTRRRSSPSSSTGTSAITVAWMGSMPSRPLPRAALFKPDSVEIKPAPTPHEIVHNVIAATPDLTSLNLEDKEFILANGTKDDAQKLWTVLQNQATPVPGLVMDASANVLKITATSTVATAKPKDYVVKLATPAACAAVPPAPAATAESRQFRTTSTPTPTRATWRR